MKITITTHRRPWIGGVPQPEGATVDASDEDGAALIEAGFAIDATPKRGRPRKDASE